MGAKRGSAGAVKRGTPPRPKATAPAPVRPVRYVFAAHGYRSRRHVEWCEDARARIEAEPASVHNPTAPRLVVQPVTQGFVHLLNVRRRTQSHASRLASICPPGSAGIGHSNGCALLLQAARLGAPLDHLVFINPALRPDEPIPEGVRFVDVFYAPNDCAVVWGGIWRRVNPVGWFSELPKWGTMGRKGYQGEAPPGVVRNWNLGNVGHGGALDWDRGTRLWTLIAQLLRYPDMPDIRQATGRPLF